VNDVPQLGAQQTGHTAPDTADGQAEETTELLSDTTPRFIELTNQEEYVLWKNWVDEIAPWVRYHLALLSTPLLRSTLPQIQFNSPPAARQIR
jgi:hypothetical protein